MKDYYKILEVNKEASQEIISKVYKILAKKYHPDLQDDSNKSIFEEKFKEISEAYEILSDESKRRNYDQELENSMQENNSDDYESLKNYCIQLENELSTLKNYYTTTSNFSNNQYTEGSHFSSANLQGIDPQVEQEAYNNAINKAYHDAYINNLKNMGYKIKYKKTFKETCKNLLSLIVTAIIIYIIYKIVWSIPSCRDTITSFFII